MPNLLNSSSRLVTFPIVGSDKSIRRIILSPGILTKVTTDDWKVVKKTNLCKKMLDNGELTEGVKAQRESIPVGTVVDKMKDDLTEDELQKIANKG